MSKKKGKVGAGTALAGLLILSGATFLWLGGLPIYRSHVSLRWTKVEGKVLSSGVATHKGDHGHFFYTPEVTYAYELGGSRYFNSQLRFGQLNSGQEIARQAAGKYPRGRAVTVYCNPRDPAMSVLEPGANPGTWPMAILGAVIIVIVLGICGLVLMGKRMEHKKAAVDKDEPRPPVAPPSPRRPFLWNIFWIVLGVAIVSWVGPTTLLGKLMALLTSWKWTLVFQIVGVVLAIALGITAVLLSAAVYAVPSVTLVGAAKPGGRSPAPRDTLESQLQSMGFRHLGDYDVTMTAQVPGTIRAYVDPDLMCVAGLVDMKGVQRVTVLSFNTVLQPADETAPEIKPQETEDRVPPGELVTSTNPYVPMFPHRPEVLDNRVPWKRSAQEVFALHQELCRIAREEKFWAKTAHASEFAENVRNSVRRDCEYYVSQGRYRKTEEDQYRLTTLGTVLGVPIVWLQMTYDFLFSWIRFSDAHFHRCLREWLVSRKPESDDEEAEDGADGEESGQKPKTSGRKADVKVKF